MCGDANKTGSQIATNHKSTALSRHGNYADQQPLACAALQTNVQMPSFFESHNIYFSLDTTIYVLFQFTISYIGYKIVRAKNLFGAEKPLPERKCGASKVQYRLGVKFALRLGARKKLKGEGN